MLGTLLQTVSSAWIHMLKHNPQCDGIWRCGLWEWWCDHSSRTIYPMCSEIVIKLRQCIIKIKSHIISIVKVQNVAPVHLRVVRCHKFKKRHHMRLLLKVFADSEQVFSLWRCPLREAFHWWRGEHSTDPAVRLIGEFSIRVSPGQEGIVLRIKQQTQDFWSQQK